MFVSKSQKNWDRTLSQAPQPASGNTVGSPACPSYWLGNTCIYSSDMSSVTDTQHNTMENALRRINDEIDRMLYMMQHNRFYADARWTMVSKLVLIPNPYRGFVDLVSCCGHLVLTVRLCKPSRYLLSVLLQFVLFSLTKVCWINCTRSLTQTKSNFCWLVLKS